MTSPTIGHVQCVCGWRGALPLRSACPACRAGHTCRITPPRLAVLRAIAARVPGDLPVPIEPMMRRWLVAADHRMIEGDGPPPTPAEAHRIRRPVRVMRLTSLGKLAVLVASVEFRRPTAEEMRDGTVVS